MDILAYLQSIGWRCVRSAYRDSDTQRLTPYYVILAADNEPTGAYGQSEAEAWRAAVELATMRKLLPDTQE